MNEQQDNLPQVIGIIAVLVLALGLIVWQIFRSESSMEGDKKATGEN